MDALLQEIQRKREHVESKPGVLQPGKKFFKRSDLIEAEKQEYLATRNTQHDAKVLAKAAEDAKKEIDTLEKITERVSSDKVILPRAEVVSRLRKREEPITLFGETELAAYQRLRKLELVDPDLMEGRKNDMQFQMDKYEQDSASSIAQDSSAITSYDVKVKKSDVTFEELAKKALELQQHDWNYDASIVLKFCQLILATWGDDLNKRPMDVKKSQHGRLEAARFMQTVDYLKPLMRKLKNMSLEAEILDSLTIIVYWTMQKEYVKANDSYLQMAIGNAPWPIGVTMHGIHARPGKDKLATKTIAHVLNDEMQRKYVQASKRLITYCQKCHPTVPSKSVEFNAL